MTQAAQLAQYGANNVGLSFKNRLINGNMVVDQRNSGASVTIPNGGAGAYTVDRWQGFEDTDGAMTAQQSSVAPAGFTNSLLFTTTTADASLGATQYACVLQKIEGLNVADLGWGTANAQPVTLSFWTRSSLTGTFGGSIRNGESNRSYVFSYTISAANTWEYKTITVPGDTSGTWLTTNGIGMYITWGLGVGSTYSGTAGSWSSSFLLLSATGATSVIGTLGATWQVTGAQLEKGTVATSYDYLPYGTQLALCQRYYEILTNEANGYSLLSSELLTASSSWCNWFFKQTKRASPTFALATGNVWAGSTPNIYPSVDHVTFSGSNYFYNSGTANTVGVTASAEL